NVLKAWIDVGDAGEITGCGYGGGGVIGGTTIPPGGVRATIPNAPLPRPPRGPGAGGGWGGVPPTVGGPTSPAAPPAGGAPALPPVAGAAGVDYAVAHPAHRRHDRDRNDRGQQVPAPLALRRRRQSHPQVGPVASVNAGQLDRPSLVELSGGHRREDTGRS